MVLETYVCLSYRLVANNFFPVYFRPGNIPVLGTSPGQCCFAIPSFPERSTCQYFGIFLAYTGPGRNNVCHYVDAGLEPDSEKIVSYGQSKLEAYFSRFIYDSRLYSTHTRWSTTGTNESKFCLFFRKPNPESGSRKFLMGFRTIIAGKPDG